MENVIRVTMGENGLQGDYTGVTRISALPSEFGPWTRIILTLENGAKVRFTTLPNHPLSLEAA